MENVEAKSPGPGRRRRAATRAIVLALALASLPAAGSPAAPDTAGWVAAWGASPVPAPPEAEAPALANATVRAVVQVTAGGSRVRVRVSNLEGRTPLRIGPAHVGLHGEGTAVRPGTDRLVTFGGRTSIEIPPGAMALSDPAVLDVPGGGDVSVSVFYPGPVPTERTTHRHGAEETWVVGGDATARVSLEAPASCESTPFLVGVDVWAPRSRGTIVALGDSITDGNSWRWPALLAARLRTAGVGFAVSNQGISGNRLLRDGAPGRPQFGKSGLARVERDVLSQPGVRHVVVYLGINDIGHPGSSGMDAGRPVTADELIAGLRQVIERGHELGLRVYGATLSPFEGTVFPGYYSAEKEETRQAVNEWIRSRSDFDGIVDFDEALQDPTHPTRLRPEFDSGDHLHPNSAGERAMSEAFDLGLFR